MLDKSSLLSDGYAHYPLAQWRNGQWADPMLAHAGAEAVRLVPFPSLLRLALLPNTAISMALAAVRGACGGLPLLQPPGSGER